MDRLDPYKFMSFIQLFGRITSTWPPDSRSKLSVLIAVHYFWMIGVFCNILCFVFIILTISFLEDDPIAVSNLFSIMGIVGDCGLHLIMVRIQWPRFKILVPEVMSFLKTAKRTERIKCRKYIKRYFLYHVLIYVSIIAAIVTFALSPLTLNKRFPIDIWYPFSTDLIAWRLIVYLVQYSTIVQTVSLVSGDCMVFALIWYSTVKLELLGTDFRKISDAFDLRNCARNHEKIIRFVGETECAIRLLIIKNLFTVFVTIVCAGVQLFHNRSLTIMSQFFFLICLSTVRLYGFSWAGDDLTEMGGNLAWSIYQSPAIDRSLDKSCILNRSLSIVLQRCQKALIISMWGTRLGLSLEFFTSYILKVMSFFMTLRVVIDRYV